MPRPFGKKVLLRLTLRTANRALLVTVNFVTYGDPKHNWLYKFMEGSSVFLARAMLSDSYRKIYLLAGANATSANFVKNTVLLTQDSANQAVDSFVHLHGSAHSLWFQDGGMDTSQLKKSFRANKVPMWESRWVMGMPKFSARSTCAPAP